MMRRWALGLALTLGACSGGSNTSGDPPEPVALVKLAPVVEVMQLRQITVYGAAEPGAASKVSLAAPAEAMVLAIDAPPGTMVRAGQPVVRLTASPATRADMAKANADATAAAAALARARRLRADGLVSDAEVETARATATAATALRVSFAQRSGALTLRAPTAGVVETVAVAPGDLLPVGAAVATIGRGGDVRARFGIDPDESNTVRAGMKLRIAATATRGAVVVPVESVSSLADPQTRLASVFVGLPSGSGVAVGEALAATIDVAGSGNVLSVPYAALLDDAGQTYVFVVAKGVAHRRDVSVDPSGTDRAAVQLGLKAGEQVIIEGGTAVEDGMKVRTK